MVQEVIQEEVMPMLQEVLIMLQEEVMSTFQKVMIMVQEVIQEEVMSMLQEVLIMVQEVIQEEVMSMLQEVLIIVQEFHNLAQEHKVSQEFNIMTLIILVGLEMEIQLIKLHSRISLLNFNLNICKPAEDWSIKMSVPNMSSIFISNTDPDSIKSNPKL